MPTPTPYADREEAAQRLASILAPRWDPNSVLIAISAGGAEVAATIAEAVDAPLELLFVEALHAPDRPDLAVGAVCCAGRTYRLLDAEMARSLGFGGHELRARVAHHVWQYQRQRNRLRALGSVAPLSGKPVVLVDDGASPLACLRLAVRVLRRAKAARTELALPAATAVTLERMETRVDLIHCPLVAASHPTARLLYRDQVSLSPDAVGHLVERTHATARGA